MVLTNEPQENIDLLNETAKVEVNGNLKHENTNSPPDGGVRAYAVMVGSFFTNGLLFGIINSFGGIRTALNDQWSTANVANAGSKASFVGALAMGMTFFLSPLSGVLTGVMGLRLTAVLGGTIAAAGLLVSSFVVDNDLALNFTYGIMYGLGASMVYTPSLAILGHYFKKHLGIVNGIVTIGSSVFTVFMTSLIDYLIENYKLVGLFRVLAVFTIGVAFCGLLFKPIPLVVSDTPTRQYNSIKSLLKTVINVEIWKNKKYRLWAVCMPIALFGYFVPYVLIKEFVTTTFPGYNNNLPLQCISAASGVGRLTFGFLADRPGVDRIMLQQISFYVIGFLTILLPLVGNFPLVIAISLGMGIFDGAFIALIGPIAFELCGSACAAQAIGCMLGLASVPLSIGPPIASLIYEARKTYTLPFVLAGLSPLLGATIMFTIRFQKTQQDGIVSAGHSVARPSENLENGLNHAKVLNGSVDGKSTL